MDNITLGQIRDIMLWLIAFSTATYTIIRTVKKAIASAFEPMNNKIDSLEKALIKQIETTDLNATKNYLVSQISEIDTNGFIDGINKQRFFEQYEHYLNGGGNSYIKHEVERLKKEGKL